MVVAHPDDDAYGIAGTVALHADDPEFRFVLVHATDGEGGDIAPGFPATRETLGSIRRAEDEAAWRAVGREPDRHEWLELPDGGLANLAFDDLVDRIGAILDEERPTVVATFGPDGIFGHPDHIALGAATDAAFARLAGDSDRGLQRLAHSAIPQSVFERWNTQLAEMGHGSWDPTQTYHMRGVPDEQIDIVVDCRPVAARTVAGLQQHRSQHHVMSDHPMDPWRWERVVSREWWTIAWPAPDPGSAMLGDLFERLD